MLALNVFIVGKDDFCQSRTIIFWPMWICACYTAISLVSQRQGQICAYCCMFSHQGTKWNLCVLLYV